MKKLTALLAVLLTAQLGFSQNSPQTGFPPFGSFQSGGFDSLNRQNLNTNISFPIVSSPGRGLNFSFSLVYDSLLRKNTGSAWAPLADSSGYPTWGWMRDLPTGRMTNVAETLDCWTTSEEDHSRIWGGSSTHYYDFAYIDATGTSRPFDFDYYSAATDCEYEPLTPNPIAGYALDNSGIYYYNGLVTIPAGCSAPL